MSDKKANDFMKEGLKTFSERNSSYGDSYNIHGNVMKALFPNGVVLKTEDDFKRFGVINGIVGKVNRYCRNFENGGHEDSAHDLGVMGFILQEVTKK